MPQPNLAITVMERFTKSVLKRSAVIVAAVALVFGTAVPGAFAQTTTSAAQIAALQAQIAALQAQLAALSGGATVSAAFTRDLTIGASGAEVTRLQQWLISRVYAIPAGATGYFGTQTQAAVAAFQSANGITPAVGYFGPITRAKVNAMIVVTPGTPTTPTTPGDDDDDDGELEGGAGSIDSYELLSGLNNEEVGEDEEDAEVAGLEIEVDEGSDIELTAVRITFAQGTATNDDFEDFASEVSLWLDGEEVGRVDADEFDEDNDYSSNISLEDAIIRSGETAELIVAVSGATNLDTADEGDSWTVDFEQVRFRDADGAVITDNPGTAVRTFTFEEFSQAAGIEINVSESDDDEDINESRVISIDEDDTTDDVEVLAFTLEIEGDSDIALDSLPIDFTVTGTAADLEDVASEATLWIDGDEVSSENTTSGDDTIVFEDIDMDLEAGEEYQFVVSLDINEISGTLAEGDTIEAEFGEDQAATADFDAEDEAGDDVGDEVEGSVTGGPHSLSSTGITVEFVSAEEDVTNTADDVGESDQGTFRIVFDVTAEDEDIRIDRSCEEADGDTAGQGVEYSITNPDDNSTICTLSSSSSDSEDTANTYEVDEGDTRRFTLTVVATAVNDNFAQVQLESINWGTETDNSNANYYTFDLDEFQTGAIYLNDM